MAAGDPVTAVLTPEALREVRARVDRYPRLLEPVVTEIVTEDVPALCDALESAWGEVARLRAALEEITRRDGPLPNLDMDDPRMPLHHAHNVIENMAGIASRALGGAET